MKPSTTEIRNRNMVRSGQHSGKNQLFCYCFKFATRHDVFLYINFSLFCSLSFHYFSLFALKMCLKTVLIQQSKIGENSTHSFIRYTVFVNTFPRIKKNYSSFSISLMGLICPKIEIATSISFVSGKDWTFKTGSSC